MAQTIFETAGDEDVVAVRKELKDILRDVKDADVDCDANYTAVKRELDKGIKYCNVAAKKLQARYDRVGLSTKENEALEDEIEERFESIDTFADAFERALAQLQNL